MDKTRHFRVSSWALVNTNQHFSPLSDILSIKLYGSLRKTDLVANLLVSLFYVGLLIYYFEAAAIGGVRKAKNCYVVYTHGLIL